MLTRRRGGAHGVRRLGDALVSAGVRGVVRVTREVNHWVKKRVNGTLPGGNRAP
ncbi:hypothetical protein GCM10009864_58630 [Streptomyces lunalinharesii]|uniref:Transposase n=1 Tax=Streptomyces lunalinharesii TaxID=333384 RepID=A0ABN3SKN2_9ACTN